MNLLDIIAKPVKDLSDEELLERLNVLRRLRLCEGKPAKTRRSNKELAIKNVLSSLDEESLAKLAKKLELEMNSVED